MQHQPAHWMPMDLSDVECKLMEVRKYSAEYFDLDTRFRRPGLELITAYHVQNPFLQGAYLLRKEQMRMQLAARPRGNSKAAAEFKPGTVKERFLFFPTTFAGLELIARNNFSAAVALEAGGGGAYARRGRERGMKFFANSGDANAAMRDKDANPRIMVVAKVLVGVTETVPDLLGEGREAGQPGRMAEQLPYFSKAGRCVDTLTTEEGDMVIKTNPNEVYPEQVDYYKYYAEALKKTKYCHPDLGLPRQERPGRPEVQQAHRHNQASGKGGIYFTIKVMNFSIH